MIPSLKRNTFHTRESVLRRLTFSVTGRGLRGTLFIVEETRSGGPWKKPKVPIPFHGIHIQKYSTRPRRFPPWLAVGPIRGSRYDLTGNLFRPASKIQA